MVRLVVIAPSSLAGGEASVSKPAASRRRTAIEVSKPMEHPRSGTAGDETAAWSNPRHAAGVWPRGKMPNLDLASRQ